MTRGLLGLLRYRVHEILCNGLVIFRILTYLFSSNMRKLVFSFFLQRTGVHKFEYRRRIDRITSLS